MAIPPVVARIFSGDSTSPLTRGGKNVVRSEGEASNPSGSRPNFFGRQHLTFDKGGKGVGDFRGIIVFFAIVVRMAVFGATGGASKARMP